MRGADAAGSPIAASDRIAWSRSSVAPSPAASAKAAVAGAASGPISASATSAQYLDFGSFRASVRNGTASSPMSASVCSADMTTPGSASANCFVTIGFRSISDLYRRSARTAARRARPSG